MLQKIIKVGNSYALTLPREFVKSYGLSDAKLVEVESDFEAGEMNVDFKATSEKATRIVDPEVYKVAKQLLKRYLPAFKELAAK